MKYLAVVLLRQGLCVLLFVRQIKGINSIINSGIQSKNYHWKIQGRGPMHVRPPSIQFLYFHAVYQ